ncbi:Dabb family protein [Lentiprolixibacter aurantiacus]|uniref:Dabb family protein n=1 Tax=Lentiprolixibacter aurantiacus TaxID=2993939 RepID=A0AAE3MJQ3_9FLAO|nr:Dabb family protein [Lentiprolixibacter aurantiacus]MCX2718970.1 Dabb family protein [Lentiprolixibacter aurantiacus]
MKNFLLTLTLFAMTLSVFGQESKTEAEFDPAFVHSVYFWLQNPDSEADRAAFEKAIHTLLENSRYTKTNFLGIPPKSSREVVDDSFTYNLFVTFESAEAQEAYQVEEAHLAFIEEAQSLWKKVVVYDAEGQVR